MTAASTTRSPAVRRERTIAAPPAAVYRAWLEPQILKQWLAPGGLELDRAEVDERVGGRYRIWHSQAGSPSGGFEAEVVELVPDERIVFRWGFVGPDRDAGGPRYDSLLTVTLQPAPTGTRLVLVHEQLDALGAALPAVAGQVGGGWDSVLDRLPAAVKG
jgi:uncharacterized protein YndB with AHSA1/START domain